MTKIHLLITVFVFGFVTMSLEIMGFRVLAPYFGYSSYVFGSLIGIVLFGMAAGYWIGGFCSERGVGIKYFFGGLLAAGFYLCLGSISYENLLTALQKLAPMPGALLSTLLLWGFPMIAMAAVSPYLVGVMSRNESPGRSAGWISMIGTLGALAGTFITSFYLLPSFGTKAVFVGNAAAIVIISIAWLLSVKVNKKWLVFFLITAGCTQLLHANPHLPEIVHAEESAYSRLEVIDYGSLIGLRTERRSHGIYSGIAKDGSLPPLTVYNLFGVVADTIGARRGLLLGLGGGSMPKMHELLNPQLQLTGVEIDPAVLRIGKEYFGLDERKNIDAIVVADARPFLQKDNGTYDLLELDIYHATEIPFYIATKEFFEMAKARLAPGGVMAMNVYDLTKAHAIQARIANTVASVFRETYVVPVGNGSFLVIGSDRSFDVSAAPKATDPRLASLQKFFISRVRTITYDDTMGIFTDDHAPIETLYDARR